MEVPAAKTRSDMTQDRSEEHTSELQSRLHLVCRLLLEKKNQPPTTFPPPTPPGLDPVLPTSISKDPANRYATSAAAVTPPRPVPAASEAPTPLGPATRL